MGLGIEGLQWVVIGRSLRVVDGQSLPAKYVKSIIAPAWGRPFLYRIKSQREPNLDIKTDT